jgi:hypothetical protein
MHFVKGIIFFTNFTEPHILGVLAALRGRKKTSRQAAKRSGEILQSIEIKKNFAPLRLCERFL